MRHSKHIWRAMILLFTLFASFLLLRHRMIPASWGLYGNFRADDVMSQMSKPVLHGGAAGCSPCHEDNAENLAKGKHAAVSCEACHGPLAAHASGGAKTGRMEVNRSAALCGRCHEALAARPKDFPQVDMREHAESMGGKPGEQACISCHSPHSPAEGL